MNSISFLLLLQLLIAGTSAIETSSRPRGFIIPHSHVDVGWVKTVEEYYAEEVQPILTTSLHALRDNPQRKFVYAEMAYYSQWYEALSAQDKALVKRLVADRQFQVIGGGWVQSDEASANLRARVNELTLGQTWLQTNLNTTATVGWQIDPFGASALTPILLAEAGFDAWVTDRISLSLKDRRKSAQELQWLWQGSSTLGTVHSGMFTHALDSWYWCSNQFQWDSATNPAHPVTDANIQSLAQTLANEIKQRAGWFANGMVLWPWGYDFSFQNATYMFANMDLLIAYISAREEEFGVTVTYATPQEYFDAVYNVSHSPGGGQEDWPSFEEDYFPFEDVPWGWYWAGHFTSRPFEKGLIRRAEATVNTAEVAYALALAADTDGSLAAELEPTTMARLRGVLAQMCHHDAVTGTSISVVVADYVEKMQNVIAQTSEILQLLIGRQVRMPTTRTAEENEIDTTIVPFLLTDGTEASRRVTVPLAGAAPAPVVFFNPHGWAVADNARVPILLPAAGGVVQVTDDANVVVPSSVIVESENESLAWLYFPRSLPPLGTVTYFVSLAHAHARGSQQGEDVVVRAACYKDSGFCCKNLQCSSERGVPACAPPDRLAERIVLSNGVIAMEFAGTDGRLRRLAQLQEGLSTNVTQNLFVYRTEKSGAYLFWPLVDAGAPDGVAQAHLIEPSCLDLTIVNADADDDADKKKKSAGDSSTVAIVKSVRQKFFGYPIEQSFRLHAAAAAGRSLNGTIHYEAIDYDIHVTDAIAINTELITRFETDLLSSTGANPGVPVFYTDNGMELRRREFLLTSTVQGFLESNYRPIVTTAAIRDERAPATAAAAAAAVAVNRSLVLLTSQAHGGVSESVGALEVMIHRRLGQDDKMGMHEALNDTHPLLAHFQIVFGSADGTERVRHVAQLLLEEQPVILTASDPHTFASWRSRHLTRTAPFGSASMIPSTVQLLSLGPQYYSSSSSSSSPQANANASRSVFRLRHLHQAQAPASLAAPVLVNIANFFAPSFAVGWYEERSLDTVRPPKSTASRWWTDSSNTGRQAAGAVGDDEIVRIETGRIHTFLINLTPAPSQTQSASSSHSHSHSHSQSKSKSRSRMQQPSASAAVSPDRGNGNGSGKTDPVTVWSSVFGALAGIALAGVAVYGIRRLYRRVQAFILAQREREMEQPTSLLSASDFADDDDDAGNETSYLVPRATL